MKKTKLLKDFPDVLAEWDYDLNPDVLFPEFIHAQSNKKYYWKCPKGHPSYLCSVGKKTVRKFGCPVCSNYKVIAGINDFESTHPELMLDWDYSKNTNIDPKTLSQRSITVVHWKCHKCGHKWSGSIRDATKKAINCPACSLIERGKKKHLSILKTKGCFSDETLLLDWDYSKNVKKPSEYSPHSGDYVFWKCHVCGYEWSTRLNNRSSGGRGCPCCSNKKLVPGINDLATVNPKLAKEWHPVKNGNLKPNMVFPSQNKKVWWICPLGHEYQATINHRSSANGTNCPICNSGRQTSFREQALYYYVKKMYSDAISRYKSKQFGKFELDIFIPSLYLAIEYDGVAWHKNEKFERERRKYQMCKQLGIRLLRVKEKMPEELGLELADIIVSSDDFESEEGFTKALHAVLEHIDYSDIYWLNPIDINLSRDRFEIMKYATQIKHSFADAFPEKAKEWHPTKNGTLKPNMFKPGSNFKAWWICPDCGNEYEQSLAHRKSGGGCPKCAIKYQSITLRMNLVKKNGSISNPLLLADWNYEKNGDKKPDFYTRSSQEKVWWKCHICGYEWQARISNREHGRGCPKCANRQLIVGYNDFATKHPELLNEWLYEKNTNIDPQHIHYKSLKYVWWKCPKCGRVYKAPPLRRSLGNACKKCADKANGVKRKELSLLRNGSIADKMPNLLVEYCEDNILPAREVSSTSREKVHWKCSVCGNDWWTQPYVRLKGCGCPRCGIGKSVDGRRKNKN